MKKVGVQNLKKKELKQNKNKIKNKKFNIFLNLRKYLIKPQFKLNNFPTKKS